MADIPAQTLSRLQVWWTGVLPETQALLDAIYMEAPGAVSRVLSGGEWEATQPEPGLAAQLGSDKSVFDQVTDVPTLSWDAFNIGPYQARPGQQMTVTWTEKNESKVPMPKYFTDVYVYDEDSNVIEQNRFETAGLAVGASQDRKFEFKAPVVAGSIRVAVYLNSEGIDVGTGIPSAQGYRTMIMDGARIVEAGDEAADEQNRQLWSTALAYLQGFGIDPLNDVQNVAEALNYLAADDQLTKDEAYRISGLGSVFAGAKSFSREQFESAPVYGEKSAAIPGVVNQLLMEEPTSQSRKRLLDAIGELADALPRD